MTVADSATGVHSTHHGDVIDVDLMNDPNHCGECGNACASGQICQQGSCVTAYPTARLQLYAYTNAGTTPYQTSFSLDETRGLQPVVDLLSNIPLEYSLRLLYLTPGGYPYAVDDATGLTASSGTAIDGGRRLEAPLIPALPVTGTAMDTSHVTGLWRVEVFLSSPNPYANEMFLTGLKFEIT
ncbi:MAG: hypothetical protein M3Q03_12635 [Chloroflexota bacterium]|nr:hypothetical protein [Chloroflexota bacterium]